MGYYKAWEELTVSWVSANSAEEVQRILAEEEEAEVSFELNAGWIIRDEFIAEIGRWATSLGLFFTYTENRELTLQIDCSHNYL